MNGEGKPSTLVDYGNLLLDCLETEGRIQFFWVVWAAGEVFFHIYDSNIPFTNIQNLPHLIFFLLADTLQIDDHSSAYRIQRWNKQ